MLQEWFLPQRFIDTWHIDFQLLAVLNLIYIQVASLASATPSVAYARSLRWVWWGREGTWLNSCDNIIFILNGSAYGLHTTWATYGNVVMFTKNLHRSFPPSLRPCLPARLLTYLPAGRPTDWPTDRSTHLLTYLPTYTYSTYLEGGNGTKFLL